MPYDQALSLSGGVGPYTIQAQPIKGAFPDGIAPNGTHLTGTPTVAKKFKFTLQVTDDDGATVNKQFSLQVFAALAIPSQTLKSGKVGKNYKATLKATGGKGPYEWTLLSGPNWLSLSSSGQLTGMPVAGPYNLDVQVKDQLNVTKQATLSLTIAN